MVAIWSNICTVLDLLSRMSGSWKGSMASCEQASAVAISHLNSSTANSSGPFNSIVTIGTAAPRNSSYLLPSSRSSSPAILRMAAKQPCRSNSSPYNERPKIGTIPRPFLLVLAPTTRYPIRRATGFKLSVVKNTSRSRRSISAEARSAPSDTAGLLPLGPRDRRHRASIACEPAGHLDLTDRAPRE